MLRIHQINCGDMSPIGGRLIDGFSHGLDSKLVCHCWVVETDDGLILVNTGLGLEPGPPPFFRWLMRPRLARQRTALHHVQRLGYQSGDVKHILLTCMDFDHVGGLKDFPGATIHVFEREKQEAENPSNWLGRRRYKAPAWSSNLNWRLYPEAQEDWYGFAATSIELPGATLWLLNLPGPTAGHAGVAILTKQGWMLHAGNAYFYRQEVDSVGYRCPLGLRVYQRFMECNHALRLQTRSRLRQLVQAKSNEIRVCSGHDFIELTAYQASAEPLRQLQKRAAEMQL